MRVQVSVKTYQDLIQTNSTKYWWHSLEQEPRVKISDKIGRVAMQEITYYVNYATYNKLLYCRHSLEQESK